MTLDLATANRAGLVLVAVLAVLLARSTRAHRPVAVFFGLEALLMLARRAWHPALVAAVAAAGGDIDAGVRPVAPLAGWGRAAGIADAAAWLAWPAGFATLAMWCFLRRTEEPMPNVSGARLFVWKMLSGLMSRRAMPLSVWAVLVGFIAASYPLGRELYPRLYTGAQLAAVLVSMAAMVPAGVRLWKTREGLTLTALCAAAVVLVEAASIGGVHVWGLFGSTWDLDRAATSVMYAIVILVQGGALWTKRS